MTKHTYRGSLASPLRPNQKPDTKLDALFADLGIARSTTNADREALIALASRHVPGFKKMKNQPGRPSKLGEYIRDIENKFGPTFARHAENAAKIDLAVIVERMIAEEKKAGNTIKKIDAVTTISKLKPEPDCDNPYYGIDPGTLLSWVTHVGPIKKQQQSRIAAASAKLSKVRLP